MISNLKVDATLLQSFLLASLIMLRQSRIVFDGIPHHITQRGNRREDVFFTKKDREVYLIWLKEYCNKHQIKILAYCLMTNHVHLILLPTKGESLSKALKPLHMRYAQRVNKIKNWSGHVWQGRFFRHHWMKNT